MDSKTIRTARKSVLLFVALWIIAFLAADFREAASQPPPAKSYRLLMLAPQEFKLPLMLFSAHKDATGMPTLIRTIEEIDSDPTYAAGRDIQEKIKLAIARLYQMHGIRYVMVVGDVDKFPVRYTRVWDSLHAGHYYAPSDLYYADLFNNADEDKWDNPDTGEFDSWDSNRNNYFGEMGRKDGEARNWGELNVDKVDLKPDVAVGRLPVSNAAELSTILTKIIDYEQKPAGQPWMKRIMLVTGDFEDPHSTADAIADLLNPLGFWAMKHYWVYDWPRLKEIPQREQLLNTEFNFGYGFVVYLGHGSRQEWGGWYKDTAIGQLQNNPRLPIILAGACRTGLFHFEDQPYQTKSGEEHTCKSEGDGFDGDATFHLRRSGDGLTVLESANIPGHAISREPYWLKIEKNRATGFRILPAQLPQAHFSQYWRSLKSYNFPDRSIRHHFYRGELTPITTGLDRQDATFRIVPGLADSGITNTYQFVSFEAWNFPGWYLGDENGTLVLRQRSTCDRDFDRRATFKQVAGLSDGSAQSFESYLRTGHFIRHRDFTLFVETGSGDLFRKDATFQFTAPAWDPYPAFRSLQVGNSNEFLMYRWNGDLKEYMATVGPLTSDADRAAATFRQLPALSDPRNTDFVSLEALMPEIQDGIPRLRSRPSYFLRHRDYFIRVNERLPERMRNRPEPAAVQPAKYDRDSMAEEFLVKYSSGAIAYIGCYTEAQPSAFDFVKDFFEEYAQSPPPAILGDVWVGMVRRYIRESFPKIDGWLDREDWYAAAIYHTPQKMMFFGDPSLRIGGVR
ncbi:MAG: C25 family cysteine peptidase [Deltaproteobacteria bacterium]|jgi:hypothetical protein|nr:C25 family cysteine peptidase [Deltaproteobacteria bacterium]